MSKKNRKNKKKKKGKESDGRGSSTGGGSSNNNNNNNRNNNDITIPTVATTTTARVLTTKELDFIDNGFKLAGYPKSRIFTIAFGLWIENQNIDATVDAFKRGADNDGCVPCMYLYVYIQRQRGNMHLVLPWALECSIRGHTESMAVLLNECYTQTKPITAPALMSFWIKTRIDLGDTCSITEEQRKKAKKNVANICYVCRKIDSNDKTFEKCGICKYYSYCGKDCQTRHWKEWKHMNECHHLKILRACCKPHYVKEIREAIISGVDPKGISRLQNLRMRLGLNRPMEEYEELVLRLSDDNDNSTIQDRYHFLTARKDGTVHIGSTPNVI